jgi:hypothetical protein
MRTTLAVTTALAVFGFSSTAGAHTLKVVRAANANKSVTRAVCNDIVDDPNIGTCVEWKSGPCSRVSAHRVRCQLAHRFEHENGSLIQCRQAQEWFIRDKGGELRVRSVPKSSECVVLRPPDPVIPEG